MGNTLGGSRVDVEADRIHVDRNRADDGFFSARFFVFIPFLDSWHDEWQKSIAYQRGIHTNRCITRTEREEDRYGCG